MNAFTGERFLETVIATRLNIRSHIEVGGLKMPAILPLSCGSLLGSLDATALFIRPDNGQTE